jgi:hypothetical protein
VAELCGCDLFSGEYAVAPMKGRIVKVDLGEPQPSHVLPAYDLVLCIEVAEHIDKRKSHVLAANLAGLTRGVLVFSAAGPGQRGRGHVNCRPQPAWIRQFRRAGMRYSGRLTMRTIGAAQEIGDALAVVKNLMVFVRGSTSGEARKE